MAKITKATVKSFIKKNTGNLYVRNDSQFDGMTDCVEFNRNAQFRPASSTTRFVENTLGVDGVYVVGGSRNSFRPYEDSEYTGIEYYNCCGGGVIAIKK
jgi:hypothetical protein